MTAMDPNGFYEDDEPIDEIVAAFQRGEKGVTGESARGVNETLIVPGGPLVTVAPNRATGTPVINNG